MLKAIIGLVGVERGKVIFNQQDITGRQAHAVIAAGLGFVPQTANIFTTLTIHENLVVGGHLLKTELAARLERAYTMFPDLAAKTSRPRKNPLGWPAPNARHRPRADDRPGTDCAR